MPFMSYVTILAMVILIFAPVIIPAIITLVHHFTEPERNTREAQRGMS